MAQARQSTLRVVGQGTDLAAALRELRFREGLTQADLGAKLGVRQQTVGAWERGEKPQPRFYDALASVLSLEGRSDVQQLLEAAPVRLVSAPVTEAPRTAASTGVGTPMNALVQAFAERVRRGPLSEDEAALFREMIAYARSDDS